MAAATKRDVATVRACLETSVAVADIMFRVVGGAGGGSLGKKMGELRRNVSKLETVLYELSLTKGGAVRSSGAEKAAPEPEA